MKNSILQSLRLGFDARLENAIEQKTLSVVVRELLENKVSVPDTPNFLTNAPGFKELLQMRQLSENEKKEKMKEERKRGIQLKLWWLNQVYESSNTLHEKMTLFWHNHFVSSAQKVKPTLEIYKQHQLFRKHAFGNLKTLTLEVLYNNAMLFYLDNQQNKVGAPNENLSRELLELFTLGIGNYTEKDIKEGAKALAGLSIGEEKGRYYPNREDNSDKTYLGKTGNLKAKDLVEAIFNHPKMGDWVAKKLIRHFITDNPTEAQIKTYGDLLRKHQFELKPVLQALLTDTQWLTTQGEKIKDPLTFMLQTCYELNYKKIPALAVLWVLKEQEMIPFAPPNVKGWEGGKTWIDTGKFIQRNTVVTLLCTNNITLINKRIKNILTEEAIQENSTIQQPTLTLPTTAVKSRAIIEYLTTRWLYPISQSEIEDLEKVLPYDFTVNTPQANTALLRLAESCMKMPEYQVV